MTTNNTLAERGGWLPIETAPRFEPILAAIRVHHNVTGEMWWEQHIIWCDDETNEIHQECEQGWDFDDYSHWMPLPPAPNERGGTGEEGHQDEQGNKP